MYDIIKSRKSRFLSNLGVFVVGMCFAFVWFSLFQNNWFVTASIGDSFSSVDKAVTTDFFLDIHDGRFVISAWTEIKKEKWKSLRVSILHNQNIPTQVLDTLASLYDFSLIKEDGGFVVLLDLSQQTIVAWEELLHLSLWSWLDAKDFPVIDSIKLFDDEGVYSLSLTNTTSLVDYH